VFVWRLAAYTLGAVAVVGWLLAFRFCLLAMDLERRLDDAEDQLELLRAGVAQ
jgi:hypothetical protein